MWPVLYEAVHLVAEPLAKAVWRPTVEGAEHVPPTGGLLIASNHLAFADSVVIPIVAPRKVVFLAKDAYFTAPGIRGRLMKAWFEGIGSIPVDRDDTRSALDSLDIALAVLARGDAFGIYPEGTRSRDGLLYRGRTGVAHLALTAGVPVVPCGLVGTERIQPDGARWPRRVPITVRFGEPLHFGGGRFAGVPLGRARREATDEIMAAIQRLCGQSQAGRYNEHPPTT